MNWFCKFFYWKIILKRLEKEVPKVFFYRNNKDNHIFLFITKEGKGCGGGLKCKDMFNETKVSNFISSVKDLIAIENL